ncbi:MAG: hypothetical protein JSW10_00925, partial [Pseudomonadota bacterium]
MRYHMMRSVLRGQSGGDSTMAVADRVRVALEFEPVVLAPRPRRLPIPAKAIKNVAGLGVAAAVAAVAVLLVQQQDIREPVPSQVVASSGAAAQQFSTPPLLEPQVASSESTRVEPSFVTRADKSAQPRLVISGSQPVPAASLATATVVQDSTEASANDPAPAVERKLNGFLVRHSAYSANPVGGGIASYSRIVGQGAGEYAFHE